MSINEDINVRNQRIELMNELKEINKGNVYFDILTQRKQHEETLKEIEGRVLGFFKGGKKFDQEAFEYYLFTLGDLTKVDKFFGSKELAIYDEKSGLKLDSFKYIFVNTYVEYAKRLKNRLVFEFNNRTGVNKELGHYQRNVRKGLLSIENNKNIGAADRERILLLYPHLMYKNKLDIKQVAKIWDVDRTNAGRNIKKLTSEKNGEIVIESKNGNKKVYSFNPKYTFSGTGKKSEHDVKVYVDFLEEVIENVKKIEKELAKELGIKEIKNGALATLHALTPYYHYETCYAVKNPTVSVCKEGETINEAVDRILATDEDIPLEFLNLTELKRIVAKNETDFNYINRNIYTLERAGAVIYTANTILINPKLMWAMDDGLNNEENPYVKYVLFKFKVEKDAIKQQRGKDKKKKEMVKKKSNKKTRKED